MLEKNWIFTSYYHCSCRQRGRHGRDHMVVGFTTIYAINAYHHWCCEFEISIRARCTTLCDKVCQWLATGRWASPGPPVSSTNKTDCHDITEIQNVLLKVALNTIKQTIIAGKIIIIIKQESIVINNDVNKHDHKN